MAYEIGLGELDTEQIELIAAEEIRHDLDDHSKTANIVNGIEIEKYEEGNGHSELIIETGPGYAKQIDPEIIEIRAAWNSEIFKSKVKKAVAHGSNIRRAKRHLNLN